MATTTITEGTPSPAGQHRWCATGKRKLAVARVTLKEGTGEIKVNRRTLENYFPRETSRMLILQALELTDKLGKVDVRATVTGGGISGQAGAVRHGIARALVALDPESKGALKKAGMLTRDARTVERKKPGQPGARKRFQYSKR